MLRKIALNCISDELNHPVITQSYRTLLVFSVLATLLITLLDNARVIPLEVAFIFQDMLIFFYSFFVVDFFLRLIGAWHHYDMEGEDEQIEGVDFGHYHSLKGYIFSYYGLIDFLAIIPFFTLFFPSHYQDIDIVLAITTLFKLARFSPALIVLKDVIISERKSLLAALYMMMILTFSISTILYFLERDVNPEGFHTLLDSIWWAIITLSTVGYGDVVPVTPMGKLLGGVAAITGFGMFALPAGILASGFAEEVRRLRDSTNWKMVAKVPLFSELEFGVIADIAKMLHVKRFRKSELIIKEGSEGDSMYFILEGSVLVYRDGFHTLLKEGDFFGEIALIKNIPRTASVLARTRCELLELTRYDFQNFVKTEPHLLEKIEEVAKERYS